MNGEYHGLVAMIPSTRPGWEVVTAPVPCLIGKFHRLNKQHVAFYDVDSPFLSVNYPELVAELGDSWEWPAEDLCKQTVRMFHSPADTAGVDFEFPPPLIRRGRAARRFKARPKLTSDFPKSLTMQNDLIMMHPLILGTNANAVPEAAQSSYTTILSQLRDPQKRLLQMQLQKEGLRVIAAMALKIRNQLHIELPKKHKAVALKPRVTRALIMFCDARHTHTDNFSRVAVMRRPTHLSKQRSRCVGLTSMWSRSSGSQQ